MAWVDGLAARIVTHERAQVNGKPVEEALRAVARRKGLARMTATRGVEGWSAHGGLKSADAVELSDDLPVVIEIVDCAEKLEAALPEIIAAAGRGVAAVYALRLLAPE